MGSFKNDFINKTSFKGGSGELSYQFQSEIFSGFTFRISKLLPEVRQAGL